MRQRRALSISILLLLTGIILYLIMLPLRETNVQRSNEAMYEAAVRDAAFADADEIYPLVSIAKEAGQTTWEENGQRLLLLSWHNAPEAYPEHTDILIHQKVVWTFTDREIIAWYQENRQDISDPTLRLEQLIGLPPDSGYAYFSAFWVKPEDIIRPAYVTDPTAQMSLSPDARHNDEWYSTWFSQNILWSYFDSAFPWTRLGYTYDWADNNTEYGLSEFLILPESEVTVEFTMTTEAFIAWLDEK